MNSRTHRHSYTPLRRCADGSLLAVIDDRQQEVAPMFEGQTIASNIARHSGCDVRHEVYNEPMRRWEYLGRYHPDGTCTHWTGERKRLTADRRNPWADIETDTTSK